MSEKGEGRPSEYRLADGTKVVGTTTVINRFKESGGLLQWAFQQGKSGAATLYEKRDEAADVGHLVHQCIQADIHGEPVPPIPDDKKERVGSAFCAYKEWFDGNRMTIVATEVPLVSETYKFGGTIDAIAKDGKDRLCLLDWKSSNAVYADYAIQLAAYRHLWNVNAVKRGTDILGEGGFHLCRFAKEHGDFEHRFWPDLTEAWDLFRLYLSAYELDKALRKRIK